MAISFNKVDNAVFSSINLSGSLEFEISDVQDHRFLIAAVSFEDIDSGNFVREIHFDGTTMTFGSSAQAQSLNDYINRIETWYALDDMLPASGGTFNVEAVLNSSPNGSWSLTVIEIQGVLQQGYSQKSTIAETPDSDGIISDTIQLESFGPALISFSAHSDSGIGNEFTSFGAAQVELKNFDSGDGWLASTYFIGQEKDNLKDIVFRSNGSPHTRSLLHTIVIEPVQSYPSEWLKRKCIQINVNQFGSSCSAAPSGSFFESFPVLVKIENDSDLKNVSSSDGFDIVFYQADPVEEEFVLLHSDIEYFDKVNGDLTAWVEILRLPYGVGAENTCIFLFYGNENITTKQFDESGAWEANYETVWHMTDLNDSSQYRRDLSEGTATPTLTANGIVQGAREFGGNFTYLLDADGEEYINNHDSDLVIQLWAKADVTGHDRGLFYSSDPTSGAVQIDTANISSGTSTTLSHTIGSQENRMLIVSVGNEDASPAPTVTGVTFNSVSMTEVGNAVSDNGSFANRVTMFYMDESDLPAAGTYDIVVTWSATPDNTHVGAVGLYNAKQQAPSPTASNNNTSSDTISLNIQTQDNDALVIDGVVCGNATTFTPDTGQTERVDVTAASSDMAISTKAIPLSATATLGWTNTGANRLAQFAAVVEGLDLDQDGMGLRYDRQGVLGGGSRVIKGHVETTEKNVEYESDSNVQTTDWQFLSFVWASGGPPRLYINGELDTPTSSGSIISNLTTGATEFSIGRGAKYLFEGGWDGLIDEIRIIDANRDECWLQTEYNNITNSSNFITVFPAQDAFGSLVWGHLVGVEENTSLTFGPSGCCCPCNGWDLVNGEIIDTGLNKEKLCMSSGSIATAAPYPTKIGIFSIDLNKYRLGNIPDEIQYRTAELRGDLEGKSWKTYDGVNFYSMGWTQIRLIYN